jgi:hypothetical protein
MTTPTDNTLTTKAVAERLGTDPKTLRVFLRATSQGVGSGSRYSFTNKDVPPLKAKFTKWAAEREAGKKAKEAEAKTARPHQPRQPCAHPRVWGFLVDVSMIETPGHCRQCGRSARPRTPPAASANLPVAWSP